MALEIINKEIDEGYAHLDRQHEQIRWFVQIYMLALGGLFAFAGHLLNEPNSGVIAAIGTTATLLVFGLGWLLLSSLAHKMSMIILIHKHISMMRGHRVAEAGGTFGASYVFPTSPRVVVFARLIRVTPYIFFGVNVGLLCAGLGFFMYKSNGDSFMAGVLSPLAGILVGIVYPRSCVTFSKHIDTASRAVSFEEKKRFEKEWDDQRAKYDKKHRLERMGFRFVLGILVIVGGWVALRGWTTHQVLWILCAHLNATAFGILRYHQERRRGPRKGY